MISRLKRFQPTPEIRTQETNKSKGFAETFISSQANSKLTSSKLLFGLLVRFVANDNNYSCKPSTHRDYTPALRHRFSWHHQPISQRDNAGPPRACAPFIANWNSRENLHFLISGETPPRAATPPNTLHAAEPARPVLQRCIRFSAQREFLRCRIPESQWFNVSTSKLTHLLWPTWGRSSWKKMRDCVMWCD